MNLEGAVPLTIPDAVEMLYQRLEAHDRAYILDGANTASIHFFTGMRLRNAWKLWDPDTLVVQDFKKRYKLFGHADDISGMLLTALWVRVRAEALEATHISAKVAEACRKSAEGCRAYWLQQGINPLTGEQMGVDPAVGQQRLKH